MLIVKGCSETQGGESPESTTQQPLIQLGSFSAGLPVPGKSGPSGNHSFEAFEKYFTFGAAPQPLFRTKFNDALPIGLKREVPTRFW